MDNIVYESLMRGLLMVWEYIELHTVTCLVPAFFIAGAIAVMVSKESVLKYLGTGANKVIYSKQASVDDRESKERKLGVFEKYLTLWVALCIIAVIVLGRLLPGIGQFLGTMEYYNVSLPIAICLFFMMYPIMVNIDFKEVVKAGKTPKPVLLTLIVNWAIKPFTMAFIAWLFMRHIWAPFIGMDAATQYIAGMILLGVAPCTAMVLVWSYLSKGNMGHTLVMVAINSLSMLFFYGPLAGFLLGINNIPIPWQTMLLSIAVYVGLPLLAGYYSRRKIINAKGIEWFNAKFAPGLKYVSISALLITLVILFALQGKVIVEQPAVIGMIALPLYIQTMLIFGITYAAAKIIKLPYEDAAPSAQIGASNHFEVAIAVATMLFGLNSGAALATVVGVLEEVPVMLSLVYICTKTKWWFAPKTAAEPVAAPAEKRWGDKMKTITIEWQRLVVGKKNTTCPRCGSTEKSLDLAALELKRLGMEVKVKKKTMSPARFSKAPTESNKILINGRPLEYWLNAKTGKSRCCSACGDSECRTVELGKNTYEDIPADLIVRACMKAAEKEETK